MRQGQAILEYLVIATVIVAAIVAVRPAIQGAVEQLYNATRDQTINAANALGNGQLP